MIMMILPLEREILLLRHGSREMGQSITPPLFVLIIMRRVDNAGGK